MDRYLTVAVIVAVLAGSVPAAATLADGSPAEAEPGAAFSGVVGVQKAEVNNEVANRSLNHRLNAAKTDESKASVVASESEQLQNRLAELEAQKEQLKQAYENGSISTGQYQARLAVLAAELRAVERQANQTADVAETLPEEALREKGANVSEVRKIAQQANESGGGAVAEAARNIAGKGVGSGLGNAPNASDRGPSSDVGTGAEPNNGGNMTDRKPTDAGRPSDNGSDPANATDGTNRGQNASAASNKTTGRNETVPKPDGDAANGSTGAVNVTPATAGNDSAANGSDEASNGTATETDSQDGQNNLGIGSQSEWLSGGLSVDGALAGLEDVVTGLMGVTTPGTTLR
jgi:hypothetical protein